MNNMKKLNGFSVRKIEWNPTTDGNNFTSKIINGIDVMYKLSYVEYWGFYGIERIEKGESKPNKRFIRYTATDARSCAEADWEEFVIDNLLCASSGETNE